MIALTMTLILLTYFIEEETRSNNYSYDLHEHHYNRVKHKVEHKAIIVRGRGKQTKNTKQSLQYSE